MKIPEKYITKAKLALVTNETIPSKKVYPTYVFDFIQFSFRFSTFGLERKVKQLAFLFFIEDKHLWMLYDRYSHEGYCMDYYTNHITLISNGSEIATEPRSVEGLMTLLEIYEQHRKQQKNNSLCTG